MPDRKKPYAVQDKPSDGKGLRPNAAHPVAVPRTAMQEALHAGALEKSQHQPHGVHVARVQQAASLEEAQDKAAHLSLSSGTSPSSGASLGPRRVSFNVGSKEADGPNSGCSLAPADSQSRAISLSELREVMRKMKFTRWLIPTGMLVLPGCPVADRDGSTAEAQGFVSEAFCRFAALCRLENQHTQKLLATYAERLRL